MKPLILSTYDNVGGASRSAYRLHQGLQKIGVDSKILAQIKISHDPKVYGSKSLWGRASTRLRSEINRLPLVLDQRRKPSLFSTQWAPTTVVRLAKTLAPDIINLHWICKGFVRPEDVTLFKKPIVWTLHDMWAFTGGCHYDEECGRYKSACGLCPILNSHRENDPSKWIWTRKKRAWASLDQTVITPSQWLSRCARESSLFRDANIQTIPYGADLSVFKPTEKKVARQKLNLPLNKKIVLFVAFGLDDPRKGFHHFKSAVENIFNSGHGKDIELAVIGSNNPENELGLKVPVHNLGLINDDKDLALIYSAADVFIAPSTQDNLPNTVIESLACGTPTVAFKIGGMPDMITHGENGYLAAPFRIEDLSQGLIWTLEKPDRLGTLSRVSAERAAQEFPLELQAKRYKDVFSATIAAYERKT
jgi:glycosyltransferase involved in cell wall biosynthesis